MDSAVAEAETSKKAKIVLSPLVTDLLHTDDLASELSPLTPISPEDASTLAPVLSSRFWHRFASDSDETYSEGPKYSGMVNYLLLPVKWLTCA